MFSLGSLSEGPGTYAGGPDSRSTQRAQYHSGKIDSSSPILKERYHSPYEQKSPYNVVVVANRSRDARNDAIRDLRSVWGPDELTIIEYYPSDQAPCLEGSIPITSEYNSADFFNFLKSDASFNHTLEYINAKCNEAITSGTLQQVPDWFKTQNEEKKAIFELMWGPQVEDPENIARIKRFSNVTASNPESLKKLGDKGPFKEICRKLGVDTTSTFNPAQGYIDSHKASMSEEALEEACIQESIDFVVGELKKGNLLYGKHFKGGGGNGSRGFLDTSIKRHEVESLIRAIVKEGGGKLINNGASELFFEESVDKPGSITLQIEIEVDGKGADGKIQCTPGARVVWVKDRKKLLEIGYSDDEMKRSFGEEYVKMQQASEAIAIEGNYETRGTVEYLVRRDEATGKVEKVYASELNARQQVEREATSKLYTDTFGNPVNVTAEKLIRSAGGPAPNVEQDRRKVHECCVHIRVIPAAWNEAQGSITYNQGRVAGFRGMNVPWAHVDLTPGNTNIKEDPKIGKILITGSSPAEAYGRAAEYLDTFSLEGDKSIQSASYYKKMAALLRNQEFSDFKVGTNQTERALQTCKPKEQYTVFQRACQWLGSAAPHFRNTRGILHKQSPIVGQPEAPSQKAVDDVQALLDSRRQTIKPSTPFTSLISSGFISEEDMTAYHLEVQRRIERRGGGLNRVDRDTGQEGHFNNTSAIFNLLNANIDYAVQGADPIFEKMETGGAIFQKGGMIGIDPAEVMAGEGFIAESHPHMALTRGPWLWGLEKLPEDKQEYIIEKFAIKLRKQFKLSEGSQIPYYINLFHAGNMTTENIEVMKKFLRHGFQVTPNLVIDRAFGFDEDLDKVSAWYEPILEAHYEITKRTPAYIRIKMPGDGQYENDELAPIDKRLRDTQADFCERKAIKCPLILEEHRHVIDSRTQERAAERLAYQKGIGHPVVMDIGTSGLTHLDPLVLMNELDFTDEEQALIRKTDRGARQMFRLLGPDSTVEQTRDWVNPNSRFAMGTAGTDAQKAIDADIPLADLDALRTTAVDFTNLISPVTPFSEGSTLFLVNSYQQVISKFGEYTLENLIAYVNDPEYGKTLVKFSIPDQVLDMFQNWDTIVPRPPHIETLLTKHGRPLTPKPKASESFDPAKIEKTLTEIFGKDNYTDDDRLTLAAYGKIGQSFLEAKANGDAITPYVGIPALLRGKDTHVGTTFNYNGTRIIIVEKGRNHVTGSEYITFDIGGNSFKLDLKEKDSKLEIIKAEGPDDVGAIIAGDYRPIVKAGDQLRKGDAIAVFTALKMETTFYATDEHDGKVVQSVSPAKLVDTNELIIRFETPAGSKMSGRNSADLQLQKRSLATFSGAFSNRMTPWDRQGHTVPFKSMGSLPGGTLERGALEQGALRAGTLRGGAFGGGALRAVVGALRFLKP